MTKDAKLSLRTIIVLLTMIAIVLTLIITVFVGYKVNQQTFINNTLDTNLVYAKKLSTTTNTLINGNIRALTFAAKQISTCQDNKPCQTNEMNHLLNQSDLFDYIFISNEKGVIQSPGKPFVLSQGIIQEAITNQAYTVSQPFKSTKGHLAILISVPIVDQARHYKGFIGGTVNLSSNTLLDQILGEHFYKNETSVYVVDHDGNIIYTNDAKQLHQNLIHHDMIKKVLQGNTGTSHVTIDGEDVLAGYSYIKSVDWGVVVLRPTQSALHPLVMMVNKTIYKASIFILFLLLISWLYARKISQPLTKLSEYAEHVSEHPKDFVPFPKIQTWYYESKYLNQAVLNSLNTLRTNLIMFAKESETDSLTRLPNRRMIEKFFNECQTNTIPFSIILLDIDNFKRINDTYGHDKGDEVILFIAKHLNQALRSHDLCARWGGEEFVVLLPETDKLTAYYIAERLRENVHNEISPIGEHISISLGVSHFPLDSNNLKQIFKFADQALYKAKQKGRNQTVFS